MRGNFLHFAVSHHRFFSPHFMWFFILSMETPRGTVWGIPSLSACFTNTRNPSPVQRANSFFSSIEEYEEPFQRLALVNDDDDHQKKKKTKSNFGSTILE